MMKRVLTILLLIFIISIQTDSSYSDENDLILIGLIPEQNIFIQYERYAPLATYLTKKTGIKFKITILSKYGDIIDRFVQRGLAGAFFGDLTGAIAIKKISVEPLVTPVTVYGSTTSYGFIIVRNDSGINSVEDMRGKVMAFVDKASVAGYLFPVAYLKSNGINNIDEFFSEYYFTGGFDASLYDVLDGRADIGCVKNTILNNIILKDPSVMKEIKIIAQSPAMPTNVLCVKNTLPKDIKQKIMDVLLNMDHDPLGESILKKMNFNRFIKAHVENFLPVYRMLESIGESPETYNYRLENIQ